LELLLIIPAAFEASKFSLESLICWLEAVAQLTANLFLLTKSA